MDSDIKYAITIIASLLSGGASGAFINNYFINKRKERKELNVSILSQEIVNEKIAKHDDIKFIYNDKEINRLDLFNIKISNSGNIGVSDFDLKVKLESGEIVNFVFNAPDDMMVNEKEILSDSHIMTVPVCVINPGESFMISLKVCDSKGKLNVYIRKENVNVNISYVNVSEILYLKRTKKPKFRYESIILLAIAIYAILNEIFMDYMPVIPMFISGSILGLTIAIITNKDN